MSTTNAAADERWDDVEQGDEQADDLINASLDQLPDELAPPPEAPPAYSPVDLNALRRLDLLKQRKRDTRALGSALEREIRKLESDLVEQMTLAGQTDGLPVDGRKATVRVDTWPKWVDTDDDGDPDVAARHAVLKAAGPEWAALVKETVNSQTLRSFLLELEAASLADGGPPLPDCLPDSVREVLSTSDQYSIIFSDARQSRASNRRAPRG